MQHLAILIRIDIEPQLREVWAASLLVDRQYSKRFPMNEPELGLLRLRPAGQRSEKGVEIVESSGKLSWSLLLVKLESTPPNGCFVVRPHDGIPDRFFGLAG
jgi:hypothetical protein